MGSPRFSKAAITRAIGAAQKRGLEVTAIEVAPDGTVHVLASAPRDPLADLVHRRVEAERLLGERAARVVAALERAAARISREEVGRAYDRKASVTLPIIVRLLDISASDLEFALMRGLIEQVDFPGVPRVSRAALEAALWPATPEPPTFRLPLVQDARVDP